MRGPVLGTLGALPPVLFQRSFGDDRLRIRTAALGRPSLLGRLSPNRFDSFEEVLTRHLGRYGPVVAINPPGTRLAPLGAARATIPHDQWQAQVHAWMDAARLVVIGSPPSDPTPGLLWELEQVPNRGLWDRLVVVCPPLAPAGLRQRWARLATAAQDRPALAPYALRLPDEPGRVLALVARGGQWLAATGERRDEWSYAAALRVAVETPTGPPPGG